MPVLNTVHERGPKARWFYWFYPTLCPLILGALDGLQINPISPTSSTSTPQFAALKDRYPSTIFNAADHWNKPVPKGMFQQR